MFLFLDVVSPIPEFHLINDKKIIVSIKIIENSDEKLSDNIIPKYLEITETYQLYNKITHLVVTTGPGSYTALRVGASFIAGLSQSMNLPISIISSENIYRFLIKKHTKSGVFLASSNNQNFLTFKKGEKYVHQKVENKEFIFPSRITNLFSNIQNPEFLNNNLMSIHFSILEIVIKNLTNLEFKKNSVIKPIYISNNVILN